MKMMYCWRCSEELPMLDEKEFALVGALYDKAVRTIKEELFRLPPSDRERFVLEQYRPAIDAYRSITGWTRSITPSDLPHHRISVHGPPCHRCGKPLRTPRAKRCVACGTPRTTFLGRHLQRIYELLHS
jgi:hypothetical protein